MARIRVSTLIEAPPDQVWDSIRDISSHVRWMDDAVGIRFLTDREEGVGTRFECDTRIGPFRLVDVMEITEWRPGKVMGVRHTGIVTGDGGIHLRRMRGGRTKVVWDERFRFPWYFGGPIGGAIGGKPLLKRVWRGNLQNLKELIESK